jgi:gliding motility-associated-like protein
MKRWLLLLWFPTASYAQCDLEILDFNIETITVAFNNTENCGGEGGPDGISEIQFGFQALDADCNAMNIGWDFPSGLSIPGDNNHPGWLYSATTSELIFNWTNDYGPELDPPYYTGDTITFPLDNVYQETSGTMFFQLFDCLTYWSEEGYSIQAVIWQISYGPTMYAADGGWAEVGPNGDGTTTGTGLYEDANFLDNWLVVGDCGEALPEVVYDTVYVELPPDTVYVELPPDTIYLLETDTVLEYDTVLINWYFYDTVFVQLPPITIYDTTYIELTPDTVVLWDTVTWYLTDTVYLTLLDTVIVEVDCETGEECLNIIECPIYAPNAFTPDADGVNDVWFVEAPEDCWDNVDVKVYSRWGDLVWASSSFNERWDGGYDVAYVRDDVYTYHFIARNTYTNQWVERSGHVVVLR